jgi:hypothetical protein
METTQCGKILSPREEQMDSNTNGKNMFNISKNGNYDLIGFRTLIEIILIVSKKNAKACPIH